VPKYQAREEQASPSPRPAGAIKGARAVHLDGNTSTQATVYERDRLDIGVTLAGPAIVEQFDATTFIPAGWSARVDGLRNMILEKPLA
jgi:N-methylhydantoinase A/oxoprolinase/acetone carboxylase beta subunit